MARLRFNALLTNRAGPELYYPMSNRIIAVDWETFYCKKSGYGISELGQWQYCNHERFDPYLLSVSDGAETWAGRPSDFNWQSLEGATLLSHNAGFDRTVYEAMVRKGMAPRIAYKEWLDTASMTSYLCNRRSLKDSCAFLLGVELSKETRDYASGKHWEDIVKDGKAEEMLSYARSDALHCHLLFTRYGHLWPQWERRLSELTIWQGDRGIQIDLSLLQEYIVVSTQMLQATEDTLPWIQEGRPATSPKAIAEQCRKHGIPCPPVKSHFEDGEARFAAWEETYGEKYPWIASVSNWRSINKFLDSLQTINQRLQPGGIFNFGLKFFGAHTGRWSGDAGFNLQNLRKVPIFRDEAGLMISSNARLKEIADAKTLPAYATAALDVRKLFIPRSGKRMIVSDLSQIEPRVLAWLVNDELMLESMGRGQSPYEAHARATMGWTGGDMKKEAKELYALAKARVLGLGYGCGPDKFIAVAQAMAQLDITKDDPEWIEAKNENGEICLDGEGKPILLSGKGFHSKRIVKEFRESNPKITALWKRLDIEFKNSAGSFFEMELPSGRKMRYTDVRKECRTVRNEETGKHERRWITTADIGGRRFSLYGGLLVENLVQATSRDVFGEHLLALQDTPGVGVLFSVHDEAVCEVDSSVSAEDVEKVMSIAPPWMPGLPVAAEAKEVPHYVK